MKRNDLWQRLDALEQQLISPLERRIEALSPADRATYEMWKAARMEWSRQFKGPGEQFAARLNGSEGPTLNNRIARLLHGSNYIIFEGEDAAEKYKRAVEQR